MFFTEDEDLEKGELILRRKYNTLSKDELSLIKPIWALRLEEMQSPHHPDLFKKFPEQFHEYCFLKAKVETLLLDSDLRYSELDANNIFDNRWHHEYRYITTLERWQQGLPVDPPLCDYNKELKVSDGRHRIVLCYYLGINTIPISVRAEKVDLIREKFSFEQM
ncbi:hypothetical protein [Dysgonomonas gadei]|uniref:ParB/Sulfiredoxin domain-containing protein n=1 Tax=Dysgonomonas gadei ATCC BAA-286 TaxID=742766 RepID=F5J3B2_9BACT|nr:hypothetical protein [Dysgonomonas gadei]EGJ99804.1 hypothetical protein HMPREF9455_03829 [Dysgonomonas gadei ATCC BAA-286]